MLLFIVELQIYIR